MKNDQLTYKIVEPGHVYAEEAKAAKASEHLVWLINSSDLILPARRIETSVPRSLGACADLVAESRLTKYDGTPIPVPVAIASCTASGNESHVTISATDGAPRRTSVPIYVHKK